MKVVTIVGARPQFIKAAMVSRVLRRKHQEVLVHTGQHYDEMMSAVFFRQMELPAPDVNLGVGSGSHGRQTGEMLARIEAVLAAEVPDWVLVYGDTNSTLAGALAAVKLQIPVAHVEAGLRSFNRQMPEEHNRVLTDHCADLLLCPTSTAVANLLKEGISRGVHLVGDVMYDAALMFAAQASQESTILEDLGLGERGYLLATIHRPYNTDDPARLRSLLETLSLLGEPVVFPAHPRTRQRIAALGLEGMVRGSKRLRLIEPVGYLDMLQLERSARMILTDSGGIQKEAYFFGVPCLTLRPETEWVETVAAGWNEIVDCEARKIRWAVKEKAWPQQKPAPVFGDGRASEKVVACLEGWDTDYTDITDSH